MIKQQKRGMVKEKSEQTCRKNVKLKAPLCHVIVKQLAAAAAV